VNATIAFKISYDSRFPDRAQKVVNDVVTFYLEENTKARQQSVAETTAFLGQEADRLAKQIQEIESGLAEFKRRNVGRTPESSAVNMQLAERTQSDLQRVERDLSMVQERRLSLEAQLPLVSRNAVVTAPGTPVDRNLTQGERLRALQAQYTSASAIYAPDHPDIRRLQREIAALKADSGAAGRPGDAADTMKSLEAELAALKERYADNHPDVQRVRRSIAALKAAQAREAAAPQSDNPAYVGLVTQIESAKREFAQLTAQRDDLRAKQRIYDSRLLQIPEIEREYRDLTRDYENAQKRYSEIKAKQLQAEGAQELEKERKDSKSQAVIEFEMDGTIVTANENFLKALGYTLAEIQGKHHSMFVEQAMRDSAAYREFWARLNRGENQSAEYKRIGKGGKEVWIQASYNPILDLNGKPFKVVKYATDTTAQVLVRMGNERVRGMMESVAAGAEELNASVREISEAMTKSRQTASTAVGRVEAADAEAKRLNEAAQAMSGIVELIGNITGQINLLALNATIESARAGEAGRGFAVVASEVKNLATQAKQATDKIGQEISNLNGISGDVVSALDSIKQAIQGVSEYVTATAAAVEEQSTVTSEMSSSMQRAAAEERSDPRPIHGVDAILLPG
jgi:PAS domain S-box-containing protein